MSTALLKAIIIILLVSLLIYSQAINCCTETSMWNAVWMLFLNAIKLLKAVLEMYTNESKTV